MTRSEFRKLFRRWCTVQGYSYNWLRLDSDGKIVARSARTRTERGLYFIQTHDGSNSLVSGFRAHSNEKLPLAEFIQKLKLEIGEE